MESIGVKNFKSIEDSGNIELKPITVAVGRNSCGKSSFIRLFPLFKQTLEKRASEAVLWYGDYVDFGDYETVLPKSSSNKFIEFSFSLNVPSKNIVIREDLFNVKINVKLNQTIIKNLQMQLEDQIIELEFGSNHIVEEVIINDIKLNYGKFAWAKEGKDFFPTLYKKGKNEESYFFIANSMGIDEEVIELLYQRCNRNTQKNNINKALIGNLKMGSKKKILKTLQNTDFPSKLSNYLNSIKIDEPFFESLNNSIVVSLLPELLYTVNKAFSAEFREVNYIKPIRAMVDRFYRVQGISIAELDSDGSNLPMMLYNMSPRKLSEFESWSKKTFDMVFSVKDLKGHISLIIKESPDSKEYTNLADNGYGYSQILPIIFLLWLFHDKNSRRSRSIHKCIVIEQPELHLHPAFQAKMIDVFIAVIKEARLKDIDVKIIFETHSETMINRLGYLISEEQLQQDWVNVLIFNKKDGKTTVSPKEFNEMGLLKGWPLGFFSPDERG